MIRLSRLADYGVALMVHMASEKSTIATAQAMSASTRLPLPTVSKLLSSLARAGVLEAIRGAKGGYRLARDAEAITMADIVSAVDGPIALTQCLEHGPGHCEMERVCVSQRGFRSINEAVSKAFASVSLAELAAPPDFGWSGGQVRGGSPERTAMALNAARNG